MIYKIQYHPRCIKFLDKLSAKEAINIKEKVKKLQLNPLALELQIKRLVQPLSGYRMRIGNIRVLYTIDFKQKVIKIYDIDFRGNIY